VREIQYSTISADGVLVSYDTYYAQRGGNKPKMSRSSQTLQVYNAKQLTEMLRTNGFEVFEQCGIDESKFNENTTERIVTIAKKGGEGQVWGGAN
jgi:hypothetical protein